MNQQFRCVVTRSLPAAVALILAGAPAMSGEPKNAAISPRQMAHCMIQRLHQDRRGERSESYRDAFKACKEDLTAESVHSAPPAINAGDAVAANR